MSITDDIKSYVDQTVATAQSQLNDVAEAAGKYRENVGDIADKANEAVNDLRVSAEKAINLDAIKTAVEPYFSQVREYGTAVTDRAEGLLNGVKDDPRLARLVETANTVSAVVLEQVNSYVVKPVQELTGIGGKPTAKSGRTAPKPAKPATTKPATSKPTGSPSSRRPSATKTTTKATSAARKSTPRKTTATRKTNAS